MLEDFRGGNFVVNSSEHELKIVSSPQLIGVTGAIMVSSEVSGGSGAPLVPPNTTALLDGAIFIGEGRTAAIP